MFGVLLIAAAFWWLGHLMGASRASRGVVLGVLFGGVLLAQVVLPPGNALREATGGSLENWLVLAGAAALFLVYRSGIGWLRRRNLQEAVAASGAGRASDKPMGDVELERYARHIVLREIGGPGQAALRRARVLVVGAGGLGSPALLYLAAAGVGTIGVIDDDAVSLSNLQRQVLHTDTRLGMPKVFSAEEGLRALNPHVAVRPYHRRLTPEIAAEMFSEYDLVLDGSDNFATRALVNAAAVAAGLPLVSGGIAQWEGQLAVFDPARGGPCHACIFPDPPAPGLAPDCAEAGVVGALPGVLGAMMALEAIKLITGAGAPLRGRMLVHDGLWGESRTIAMTARHDCAVCQGRGMTGRAGAPGVAAAL
ncbi:MAG: HesA/MoeB/ThiF family protein [Rhodobacteraceae bacterium]|nr:HesA/MoeB/ThiF family protein [Paracoccaceae bacterium]